MEEEQFRGGQEPGGERVSREGVERLRALIGGSRVAMMTTVESGGALRSRPMAVQEVDDDGVAWLITQRTSPKVEEVEREHHVNLAFLRPARGRYLSVSGRATMVKDDARIRKLWHPTLQAWFPDGLDDPELCLLRVHVDKAESWDAPVGNLAQVARLAGSIFGRTPRPSPEEGRDTLVIRTHQAGIGDTAGILGTAGGNMGEAPRAPRDRGGPRIAGSAGGTMGEAVSQRRAAPARAEPNARGTQPPRTQAPAPGTSAKAQPGAAGMSGTGTKTQPATSTAKTQPAGSTMKGQAPTAVPTPTRAPPSGRAGGVQPATAGPKATAGPRSATTPTTKPTPGDVKPEDAALPRKGGRGR